VAPGTASPSDSFQDFAEPHVVTVWSEIQIENERYFVMVELACRAPDEKFRDGMTVTCIDPDQSAGAET
jgi:hypothetical protein